jgi:hypothetical protein
MFYAADLDSRKDSYRALWRAVDAARSRIASTPDKYRHLLSDRLGFSEDQARTVSFPPFPRYEPTSAEEIERASAWMLKSGLITKAANYQEIVALGILP